VAAIHPNFKLTHSSFAFSYQAEVNRSMAVYRQKYEDWFNSLTEAEREAESARLNSNKSARKPTAVKVKQEMKPVMAQMQQQPPPQILANLVRLSIILTYSIYFILYIFIFILPPYTLRDSNSRPMAPRAETIPLDHTSRFLR
jgi:hypothetical protein